ncbi:MAG: ABC transporter ATP-binding protein [Fimbriimonas sp.]
MVTATNLRKTYGPITAVEDVSFEIKKGELFGLLGPNGAGKSTTIGMLVGAVNPDSGAVDLKNQGPPTLPKNRQLVGLAPQSLALYDELTAKENLQFYGAIYGLSAERLKDRVEWCLTFAGLNDRANHLVKTFSGGMKRRVNMAAALIHEPELVLFDEPTVGVDPQSRNYIFDSIQALKEGGTTILYTTHYMEEAQRLCDRVAIMDKGKILALDTVDGLLQKYGGTSVLTAELMDPEMVAPVGATIDGSHLRMETREPLKDLASLSDSGAKFKTLRIDRPDLESVFLSLTGRSLRD